MSRSDGYGAGSAQREASLAEGVTVSAGVQVTVAIITESCRGSIIATVVGVGLSERGVVKLGIVDKSAGQESDRLLNSMLMLSGVGGAA